MKKSILSSMVACGFLSCAAVWGMEGGAGADIYAKDGSTSVSPHVRGRGTTNYRNIGYSNSGNVGGLQNRTVVNEKNKKKFKNNTDMYREKGQLSDFKESPEKRNLLGDFSSPEKTFCDFIKENNKNKYDSELAREIILSMAVLIRQDIKNVKDNKLAKSMLGFVKDIIGIIKCKSRYYYNIADVFLGKLAAGIIVKEGGITEEGVEKLKGKAGKLKKLADFLYNNKMHTKFYQWKADKKNSSKSSDIDNQSNANKKSWSRSLNVTGQKLGENSNSDRKAARTEKKSNSSQTNNSKYMESSSKSFIDENKENLQSINDNQIDKNSLSKSRRYYTAQKNKTVDGSGKGVNKFKFGTRSSYKNSKNN